MTVGIALIIFGYVLLWAFYFIGVTMESNTYMKWVWPSIGISGTIILLGIALQIINSINS